MQGRLGLTTSECLAEYDRLAKEILGHPKKLHVRNRTWVGPKYDGNFLEQIVDNLVDRYLYNSTEVVRRPTLLTPIKT
jgi:hypothetical protein